MSRRMLLGVAVVLGSLLVLAAAASAQVNPSDITNLFISGAGTGETNLMTLPAGSWFVVTDFEWHGLLADGDHQEVSVSLVRGVGGLIMWNALAVFNLTAATAYQTLPIGGHWTTGLVFPSSVDLRVFMTTGRPWQCSLSGYMVPAPGPGALGEQSSPAVPLRLGQNTPNPFNPTTAIKYTLASPGEAALRFFDSQGRLVRTLAQGRKDSGEFTVIWDGRNDAGESLASGVYYYELSTGVATETRKAVLLK